MTAKIQDLQRLQIMHKKLSQLDADLTIQTIGEVKIQLETLEGEFNKYSNWKILPSQYPRRKAYDSFASLIQSTNQRLIALSEVRKNIKIDVNSPPIDSSNKSSPRSLILVFKGTTVPVPPPLTPYTPSKSSQKGRQSLEFDEPVLPETPYGAAPQQVTPPLPPDVPANGCCVIS